MMPTWRVLLLSLAFLGIVGLAMWAAVGYHPDGEKPGGNNYKRLSGTVAEGFVYRVGREKFPRATCSACRVGKMKMGLISLGAFNTIEFDDLVINIPEAGNEIPRNDERKGVTAVEKKVSDINLSGNDVENIVCCEMIRTADGCGVFAKALNEKVGYCYDMESWGRWLGKRVRFVAMLPAAFRGKVHGIRAMIAACASALHPTNSVHVKVGGREILCYNSIVPPEPKVAELPDGVFDANGRTLVEVTTDFEICPKDEGVNADTRHLGIAFISLEFGPFKSLAAEKRHDEYGDVINCLNLRPVMTMAYVEAKKFAGIRISNIQINQMSGENLLPVMKAASLKNSGKRMIFHNATLYKDGEKLDLNEVELIAMPRFKLVWSTGSWDMTEMLSPIL